MTALLRKHLTLTATEAVTAVLAVVTAFGVPFWLVSAMCARCPL